MPLQSAFFSIVSISFIIQFSFSNVPIGFYRRGLKGV
jgi:hypothetical protein